MIVYVMGVLSARKRIKLATLAPLIIAWICVYGYIHSFITTADRAMARQFVLAPTMLFVIYPVLQYGIDLDAILKRSGLVLAYTTSIYFLSDTVARDGVVANAINHLFVTYGAGAFGQRQYYPVTFNFLAFGSAPFLFLPFAIYAFELKPKFWPIANVCVIGFAILLSASRGVIITSALAFSLAVVSALGAIGRKFGYAVITAGFFIGGAYAYKNTDIFSSYEYSNAVKLAHITSFLDNLTTARFFFGHGLASYYYSAGSLAYKANTEITYLDFCRYVGVPLATLLYWLLLIPSVRVFRTLRSRRNDLIMPTLFVAISLTNPTLFLSFGLLGIVWYWNRLLRRSNAPTNPESNANDKSMAMKIASRPA